MDLGAFRAKLATCQTYGDAAKVVARSCKTEESENARTRKVQIGEAYYLVVEMQNRERFEVPMNVDQIEFIASSKPVALDIEVHHRGWFNTPKLCELYPGRKLIVGGRYVVLKLVGYAVLLCRLAETPQKGKNCCSAGKSLRD